ncbi:hypothetical protein RA19_00150 [Leisingera sp. ANG-M1]|uniref:hypothetical protein n=1 Tax=Leisingera sp. ANG-M1 TaxID=1577895 RepID=UPI00057DA9E0|nr:hypothetical protein [Leisingera sp. ANG-M1]KIC12855.1 hypothetical protein RA19_00150 [Leisingera sp. ANG-M1]
MLRAIVPVTVTEALLISTNVPEDDGPEWDAGTPYNLGDRVIISAEHKVFESAVASNSGADPLTSPASWLEVGATNGWRAFDRRLSAPTTKAGQIKFVVEPASLVRAVGLVGAKAASATVKVRNQEGDTLVERTQMLADYGEMIDALTMVLVPPDTREFAIFEDIICQPGNQIEILIGDGSGQAEVSEVVLGDVLQIGTALYDTEVGTEDFSDFNEDQFGNVDIVERGYRDITDFPVAVQTSDAGRIKRRLNSIRAQFALYYFTTGGNDYGTTVYGRYERLSTVLSGPSTSDMNLKILGATYGA